MMRTVSQVECNSKDASVVWEPRGDNRAPILTYKIQYNTTFLSDTWETAAGDFATFRSLRFYLILLGGHSVCLFLFLNRNDPRIISLFLFQSPLTTSSIYQQTREEISNLF